MDSAAGEAIGTAAHTWSVPRKRMAAAVLFTDAQDRVLLVEPSYKDVWELPGGAVEADESPRTSAAREVKEELGLVISPGRLVAVDWVPPLDGRAEGVAYVYDGGTLASAHTNSITLPDDELVSWAWCTRDEVRDRMRSLVARRVEAALTAIQRNGFAELENGDTARARSADG